MTTPIEQAGPGLVAEPPVGTPVVVSAPPDCPYCGGAGYYIGGDELHVCWCQQPDVDVAAKAEALR